MVDALGKQDTANDSGKLTDLGMNGLAMLGHGFHNLCLRRRELHKPDVAWKYGHLFSANVAHNEFLYGDNVEKLIKDIGNVNQVSSQLKPSTRSRSTPSFANLTRGKARGGPVYYRPRGPGYPYTRGPRYATARSQPQSYSVSGNRWVPAYTPVRGKSKPGQKVRYVAQKVRYVKQNLLQAT